MDNLFFELNLVNDLLNGIEMYNVNKHRLKTVILWIFCK